jgi:hypothetical protein
MLSQIKHYFQNPDDIPAIPAATAEFLKARLNMAYLIGCGEIDQLRKAGWSEPAILGFLEGVNAAVEVVELMERTATERYEDQQVSL